MKDTGYFIGANVRCGAGSHITGITLADAGIHIGSIGSNVHGTAFGQGSNGRVEVQEISR